MKYILEIRRPFEYETVPFEKMVRSYVSSMYTMFDYIWIEFFDTVTQRARILDARQGDGKYTIDPKNAKKAIRYKNLDTNPEEDYFYTSVDILEEYQELFYEGRGALIPRFSEDKTFIVALDYVRKGGQ